MGLQVSLTSHEEDGSMRFIGRSHDPDLIEVVKAVLREELRAEEPLPAALRVIETDESG